MGSTKVEAKKLVETWKEKDNIKVELLEGNQAADQFDSIPQNYDVLVILTSSYGDGDAPSGYGKFLFKMYEAAKSGTAPLKGMEHSVLGLGSTAYYTFQNVPRLTDRLLGESGSRRFLMRTEVDEMEDLEVILAKIQTWSNAVVKHCNTKVAPGTGSSEPVCEWTCPESEVYEKRLGPDGYELGEGPGQSAGSMIVIISTLGVAIAAAYSYFYVYKDVESIV